MRIKLAILESDVNYLQRIVSVFGTKYADKLEIYSFTDKKVAMDTLESAKIDVLIANDSFEIDSTMLPKRCGFAYFVDSTDVETKDEKRAIGKFQKADLIYKQILSLYSEKAQSLSGLKLGDDSAKVLIFSSPCGGTGTSSMAAACASYFAKKGKKVLYLNLEKFGSADVFFSADGQFDISDIIFALKTKKANLSLKLESCVKQAAKGVHFYSQSKVALDMVELTSDEIIHLISELKLTSTYDYIIVDMDFGMDKEFLNIFHQAHALVWVGDGAELSNNKIRRAYSALAIREQKVDSPLVNRISLIYNKFSNKSGKTCEDIGLKHIGGAPRLEHASAEQVLAHLSGMEFFEKII